MSSQLTYASHLIPLLRCLDATSGPVLELGIGFSTSFLYWYCKENNRQLVSYENDKNWFKQFFGDDSFQDEVISAKLITDWDSIEIDKTEWSVVLIDHRPALRRKTEAVRVKDNAEFVLLHDSEPEINRFYRYDRVLPHFRFSCNYDRAVPNTLILSNKTIPYLF